MASFRDSEFARSPRAGEEPRAPLDLYLARRFLPLAPGVVALADWSARNLAWMRRRFPGAELVFLTPSALNDEIVRRFGRRLSDDAILALDRLSPLLSARRVVTKRQAVSLVLFCLGLLALGCARPSFLVIALVALMSVLFLLGVFFRAALALAGSVPRGTGPVASDEDLPVYTILVPLYREAAMIPALSRALLALDYPCDRLDIKLIVEADDPDTARACAELDGPFEVVGVPPSLPRTKPKAVNFALNFARGDFVVIYDAEDRPEPDQLRKAVGAFRALPDCVACLQARLAFYNARENWLTGQFEADYRLWFGMLLPGLDRIGMPIPLGGTSNHFRAEILRRVGAWDPFNVTEDADLGIRLAQAGFRVAMLDSTTFEEAPTCLSVWLRQRSRWLKGYMQTWLVHSRATLSLARGSGFRGIFAFHFFIGGAVLSAIVNPLLWGVCALSLVFPGLFPDHVAAVSAWGALGSNSVLVCLVTSAAIRCGDRKLLPCGLTVALYWLLISAAAYRGLWHLITKPFHWEKTAHGLSRHAAEDGDA
jgi:cellulose synthase/poly-beta-1,6-N-acetylglucosamine synthase-like glycosyltransferase